MKVALVGSRDIPVNPHAAAHIIRALFPNCTEIVSGGCNQGADSQAHLVAALMGVEYKEFKADWDKHGRAAGPIRNKEIVKYSDGVVAYWDGKSRGTKSTIDFARARKIWTIIITPGEDQ